MEFDITKHNLVPKHEKLSKDEKAKFLKEFNLSLEQLPKIKVSDKALKGVAVEIGDVIKIIRKSPTMKEALYYRVVISG